MPPEAVQLVIEFEATEVVPSPLFAMDSVKLVPWTALEGVADGNSRRSLDRHTGQRDCLCGAGRGFEVVVRQHHRAVDGAIGWLNPSIFFQEVVSGKHPSQHPRRSSLRPNCLIASTSVDALAIDLCRVEAKVTHICNGKSPSRLLSLISGHCLDRGLAPPRVGGPWRAHQNREGETPI